MYTGLAGKKNDQKNCHESITYRNFKHFNEHKFLNDLYNAPWSLLDALNDVNEMLATCKSLFLIPELNEWMTAEIMQQIRIRDQFNSQSKSNTLARVMYKRVRNHVVKLINNAKANYFKQQSMDNKNNVKNLWKILKRVVPIKPLRKQQQQIEVDGKFITDPVEISNAFNQYFVSLPQSINLDVRGDNPEMVAFFDNLFHNL